MAGVERKREGRMGWGEGQVLAGISAGNRSSCALARSKLPRHYARIELPRVRDSASPLEAKEKGRMR